MVSLEDLAQFLNDDKLTGRLIIAVQQNDPPKEIVYYKTRPSKKVVNEYRKAYLNRVKTRVGLPVVEQDSMDETTSHDIQRYNINEVPNANDILDPPIRQGGIHMESVPRIKYTSFQFTNNKRQKITIFRRYKKNPLLTQKRLDLLILREVVIDFAKKDMLHLDRRADCVVYDNEIFVFWKSGFERIFNYTKVYKQQAKEVYTYLKSDAPYKITGLEKFEKETNDLDSLRTLSNIHRSNFYQTLNIRKLKKLSKDTTLGMTVNVVTGTVEFVNRDKFLHFFKDDDLNSPASGRKYTAYLKKIR